VQLKVEGFEPTDLPLEMALKKLKLSEKGTEEIEFNVKDKNG